MAYQLTDINYKTVTDPKGFVQECDAAYHDKVEQAARKILENRKQSPIVLLSGPSGSGKTTTAMKIAEALEKHGVRSHYVAMDDYFQTVDLATSPRTPEGELDLESPLCLDMELLNRHFTELSQGKRIYVPKYEFSRKMRIQEPSKSIKLKDDEIVIFEGIHALNDMITERHPEAFKLYISARSDVLFQNKVVFKRTWFRLVRRTVRDYLFRGSDPAETMAMWANVRRGVGQRPPGREAEHLSLQGQGQLSVRHQPALRAGGLQPDGHPALPLRARGGGALRRAPGRAARAAALRRHCRGGCAPRFPGAGVHRRRHLRVLRGRRLDAARRQR